MMIQPIRTTLPALKDIKNVDYTQAKTKADKFAQMISEHAKPKTINEESTALNINDQYNNTDNIEIQPDENDKYIETDANKLSFPDPKDPRAKANKFIKQIDKEEYSSKDFEQIGFVQIEDKKVKSDLPLPKINIKDTKEISFKNEIIDNIRELPIKQNFKTTFLSKLDNYLKSHPIKPNDNVDDVTTDFLGKVINETIHNLIENAEFLESTLNLEISPDTSKLQLEFFEKLRSIITDLDKSLIEVKKRSEAKKADSKVEVKIKRFDMRDLKTVQNRKI